MRGAGCIDGRPFDCATKRKKAVECSPVVLCGACEADQNFLRLGSKPARVVADRTLRAVDLFAGCGGMSIGLEEAARRAGLSFEVAYAVDHDQSAMEIYRRNVHHLNARVANVEALFDGEMGASPTQSEQELRDTIGDVDILAGGPPCQGHSDLTRTAGVGLTPVPTTPVTSTGETASSVLAMRGSAMSSHAVAMTGRSASRAACARTGFSMRPPSLPDPCGRTGCMSSAEHPLLPAILATVSPSEWIARASRRAHAHARTR
jgi:hypothetical protein